MSTAPPYIASPCVKTCALDPVTGQCIGCYRTMDEIADWLEYSSEEKLAVLERVAQRKAAAQG